MTASLIYLSIFYAFLLGEGLGGGGKRNIAHSERYLILFSLHNIQLVLAGGGDSATMKLLELDYIFCPSSARNIVSLYILAII